MMFSIVVPTYKRNDLLSNCLKSLSPNVQSSAKFKYEVIVSDDSKEGLAKSLIEKEYSWATWVSGPKKGPAANRNNGAELAGGEWVIFIDDDCLPDSNLLNSYYEELISNNNVEVFEGCIKADREQKSFIEESPVNEEGGYLWSCNFMIKKNLFVMMKGFDEGFPFAAMEDVELDLRLRTLNHQIKFTKSAFVVHPWRLQTKMYQITMNRFKSLLYFLHKHPQQAKKLNSIFFFRIAFNGFKSLFAKSIAYKFKGVGGKLTHTFLHIYFGLYFIFNRVSTK